MNVDCCLPNELFCVVYYDDIIILFKFFRLLDIETFETME